MSRTLTLIVTDTSPLITLALAGELDLLLRPGIQVNIPDAVFNEATRVRTAGGASAIIEWTNAHLDQVHIVRPCRLQQQRLVERSHHVRPHHADDERIVLGQLFLDGRAGRGVVITQ